MCVVFLDGAASAKVEKVSSNSVGRLGPLGGLFAPLSFVELASS